MMGLWLGIDEAGRGSALGSLVVCGFAVDAEHINALGALGLRDSKALSAAERTRLAAALRPLAARIVVRRLRPGQVDAAVSRGGLNAAELEAMAALIRAVRPEVVWVDALTSRPEKFGRQLEALVAPLRVRIVAENRADARYPVVQAAAIIAKVTRDGELARLRARHGDLGSGYPSDPRTRTFLKGALRAALLPRFVRRSWGTLRVLAAEGAA